MVSVTDDVVELFASVSEALARATWALLNDDVALANAVVAADRLFDQKTAALEARVWCEIEKPADSRASLRELVPVLLILPELERSADLAEHIASRACTSLGNQMTPTSRGIVQRMSEAALELWQAAGTAYARGSTEDLELHEADEELDILHGRLTAEVADGGMEPGVAAQVTLLARFYERLGDHAVNLSRRIAALPNRERP